MIDFKEFLEWMKELQGKTEFINHAKFFSITKRKKSHWSRKEVSSCLRYMHNQGMIKFGKNMEIYPRFIIEIRKKESGKKKKTMKKIDPDAYLHQKELSKWMSKQH